MLLATFRSDRSLEADPEPQKEQRQKERLTPRVRREPEGEWLALAKKESSLLGKELARPDSEDAPRPAEHDRGLELPR